jgi:hypothetical protein
MFGLIFISVIICIGVYLLTKQTNNDQKKYLLTGELLNLSRKLETVNLDDNAIRKTSYHVEELKEIIMVSVRPLNKGEEGELKINLKLILQPRFNNYKNGTKQNSRQIKNSATLRVHYTYYLNSKIEEYIIKMKGGKGITCNGISSQKAPISDCYIGSILDPRKLNMTDFILDHYIEQNNLNKAMIFCLTELGKNQCTTGPFLKKHNINQEGFCDYIMENFREPPKTLLEKELSEFLENHINLALYRDDLYGNNIYLRCHNCNVRSKSKDTHMKIEDRRYLLI